MPRRKSRQSKDTTEQGETADSKMMEEEIMRNIEKTTTSLATLLLAVESTAAHVCLLAEEHESTIEFFSTWHRYLKAQQTTTGTKSDDVEMETVEASTTQ